MSLGETAFRCNEITNLTMGDVDDLGSANLLKIQDLKITNRDPSPFWGRILPGDLLKAGIYSCV
jgi:hypothetical protein